ncbi:DNA-binding transcriptional regulator, MarR family [Streptomyces zhaozhouensis]|uniref:DNA-binding transcriptional regulator, MarR family n=1 Tax=Streptomyces zhaozhouensis TaxID=1300267 RepID=A0A286DSU4_9ACTN|nr:MarR family transcriptional regulator [Streptomyces zhaozhouensis]SOD61746.1 DNA-binding transcriptional regulator, MarR family [Streptomyces zhaozhouensis]
MSTQRPLTGIGTRLRHLLDLLEADLASVYPRLGLDDYRPRYSPVIRALVAHGPSTIGELAEAMRVTHSAASQTVAQLTRRGLVELSVGRDARQRVVRLTERGRELLPVLDTEWEVAEAAMADLDAELSVPLSRLLTELERALERRPYRERVAEAVLAVGPVEPGGEAAGARAAAGAEGARAVESAAGAEGARAVESAAGADESVGTGEGRG